MRVSDHRDVPRYGLLGSFVGKRWDQGRGGGVCETAHCPQGSDGILLVKVVTRMTRRRGRDTPWTAISSDEVRYSVAMSLVADSPGVGDNVFAVARGIADDDDAWKERCIGFDGDLVEGYECEFAGRWVVYYPSPCLIVEVVGPVELRPKMIDLGRIKI